MVPGGLIWVDGAVDTMGGGWGRRDILQELPSFGNVTLFSEKGRVYVCAQVWLSPDGIILCKHEAITLTTMYRVRTQLGVHVHVTASVY